MWHSSISFSSASSRSDSAAMRSWVGLFTLVWSITSEECNDLMEYNTAHTQWEGDKKVHQLEQLYTTDGVRLETDVERYQSKLGKKR